MKELSPSATDLNPTTLARSPLSEAIRSEVVRLCEIGDQRADGTFTAELCSRIMRVVKAGRDLILTEKATGLSDLIGRKHRVGNTMFSNGDIGEDVTDEVIGGFGAVGSFNNENFGMTALRELIGMARGFNDSPEKLVAALAAAREHKLDDVAALISTKLGLQPLSAEVIGQDGILPLVGQIEAQISEGSDEL